MAYMQSYKASAPGSLMLLGEHAVLQGYPAISCAISKYVTVELLPRDDKEVAINSTLFGQLKTHIGGLELIPPFTFILAALKRYQDRLLTGCTLQIDSEFSADLGLGSSAAIVAAVLAVIRSWLQLPTDLDLLFSEGLAIIHTVQGIGSGADLAASLYGGIIKLDKNVEKIAASPPLSLLYVGYKTPTVEVVKRVQAASRKQPEIYAALFAAIGDCVLAGYQALQQDDWLVLGEVFNQQQKLLRSLGVSDPNIDHIISQISTYPNIYGVKISGSGLGDCVVALGKLPSGYFPPNSSLQAQGIQQIDIAISSRGLMHAGS